MTTRRVRQLRRPSPRPPSRACSESGDTLVEVLIAIVIIALTAAALLNSLTTSIQASAVHQRVATIDTLLKSYAEAAKQQIQFGSAGFPPSFSACNTSNTAPPSTYSISFPLSAVPPGYTPAVMPPGYTVAIPAGSVLNWDPAATPAAFDSNCTHSGIQQVTVTAKQTATGINDSLTFLVLDPRYPQGS